MNSIGREKMLWIFGLLILLVLFFLLIWNLSARFFANKDLVFLEVNGEVIKVWLADDDQERFRGLSDRVDLGPAEGMLFLYDRSEYHAHVMRRMLFPLDFLFVDGDQVVDLVKGIPQNFPGLIKGRKQYDKVLELPAGWINKHKIQVGDKIKFLF